MNTQTTRTSLLSMPHGFGYLFFIQIFSTISFAILFASLVLYMNGHLHFSEHDANLTAGIYFAINFALHQLAGYIGGRYLSYRTVVLVGIVSQLFGTIALAHGSLALFYWGLAGMLLGTGMFVTCLNMLLSQLFTADEVSKRETAFFWNYSGMNIGFVIGFTLAGYFQLHDTYTPLFIFASAFNIVTISILSIGWRYLRDKNTSLSHSDNQQKSVRKQMIGVGLLLALLPALHFLLHHVAIGDGLILTAGFIIILVLAYAITRYQQQQRRRFLTFFILLVCAQIFWIIYQLAPMSLLFFAKNNVDLHVLGWTIAPGWLSNINAFTICIGGPLLARYFMRTRQQGNTRFSVPIQFTMGIAISAVGLLILPIGIAFAKNGYVSFSWLFSTYVLEGIAELLISPIGYAMVGLLVPARWQSVCMGTLLLNSGVAAVFASFFSNYAAGIGDHGSPLLTNPHYSHAFTQLGLTTLGVAFVLLCLSPLLNYWIGHTDKIRYRLLK